MLERYIPSICPQNLTKKSSQKNKVKYGFLWFKLTKPTKLAKPKNTPPILKQHIVLNVAQLKD